MRGWFERGERGGNAEYAEVFWGGAGLRFNAESAEETRSTRRFFGGGAGLRCGADF